MNTDESYRQTGEIDDSDGEFLISIGRSKFVNLFDSVFSEPFGSGKIFEGSYVISHADVRNLFRTLADRVRKQNSTEAAKFTAKVVGENGETENFDSFNQFDSYQPDDLRTNTVFLKWVFLIQFPGEDRPHKQEVIVSINTTKSPVSDIELEVRYTDKSWSRDIISLVSTWADPLVERPSKLRRWFSKMGFGEMLNIFFPVAVLLLLLAIIMFVRAERNQVDMTGYSIGSEMALDGDLETKVDFVVRYLIFANLSDTSLSREDLAKIVNDNNLVTRYEEGLERRAENISDAKRVAWWMLGTYLLLIIVIYSSKQYHLHAGRSYMLLTRKDESEHSKYQGKKRLLLLPSLGALIVQVICSIIAAFLYSSLF